ncbi:MAG: LamG-like jellyroll fold domain-containing protein, partial [Dehalococcoidia bacterium]
SWLEKVAASNPDGFASVFGAMFPETDPIDGSNQIDPPGPPPVDLLQFPFPLGATWYFNGPHSWHGGDWPPPYSSMDFFSGGGTCSSPPYLYSVAAAHGEASRPGGYDCWLEINHGNGWTTSYYHLLNMHSGGVIDQNGSLGTIACETCAGGFATGPHLHFSLKYNGAYASLEGVTLSGWTVRVGPEPYDTGYIERDGQVLDPYSQVVNDYHLFFVQQELSLRFYGNGQDGIDRVQIRLDEPVRPADVGEDFTLEWWMKALPGENAAGNCSPEGDTWAYGNVMFDRDVFGDGDYGDYGISLADGRIAFGVNNGLEGHTLCGLIDVADGLWHHIAVTRSIDGNMRIFVDGQLDNQIIGPSGDVSYRDGRATSDLIDPYLVIGAEKHDLNGDLYPSFSGWIDEVRLSNVVRYAVGFEPPDEPFITDSNTVALYSFNEGVNNTIRDISGYPRGPSNGYWSYGGDPAGPEWSVDAPFATTFVDVPVYHWAHDAVEAIFQAGITQGCAVNPQQYCPDGLVTRAQMATFIGRGLHSPDYNPGIGTDLFADVPTAGFGEFAGWIELLYSDGITAGCSADPLLYCPNNPTLRNQMAVFLVRAKHGEDFIPPQATGLFDDVPLDGFFDRYIEQLHTDGITLGCGTNPLRYCPNEQVSRAEMAVFLARTFDLMVP